MVSSICDPIKFDPFFISVILRSIFENKRSDVLLKCVKWTTKNVEMNSLVDENWCAMFIIFRWWSMIKWHILFILRFNKHVSFIFSFLIIGFNEILRQFHWCYCVWPKLLIELDFNAYKKNQVIECICNFLIGHRFMCACGRCVLQYRRKLFTGSNTCVSLSELDVFKQFQ